MVHNYNNDRPFQGHILYFTSALCVVILPFQSNGNAVEEQRERKVTIQESCEAVCQPA